MENLCKHDVTYAASAGVAKCASCHKAMVDLRPLRSCNCKRYEEKIAKLESTIAEMVRILTEARPPSYKGDSWHINVDEALRIAKGE